MLEEGLRGKAEVKVEESNTARQVGSGSVEVFATPMLVALVETAAINALAGRLPPGQTSVGTHIDLKHLAATPVGMTVRAEAVLTGIKEQRLIFRVEAYDAREKVGEGTHRRYLLEQEGFVAKAKAKTKAKAKIEAQG